MDVKKVLYISQEIHPYVPANAISNLCCELPRSIHEKGSEVRTFMPRYGIINERRNQLHEVIRLSGMNIIIDDTDHPLIIKVATMQPTRMQVYFMDNDDYFERHSSKGLETATHADDNDERSIFFVRGAVETVKKLRWDASVVHCTGWITALAPLYLKHKYNGDPSFRTGKIVVSLVPDAFEGTLDERFVEKLRMEGFEPGQLEALAQAPVDYLALMRIAIDNADAIVEALPGAHPDLVEYARASGKPFLACPSAENYAGEVADFYASL
ncbi:MAG: glycogen/starch synthase [Muribaculaceae bacterium]|nr:glycogen/starch synthase [Muribaculaceae bacterium]